MNVMAPIATQQKDVPGAHQMLSSAFSLAKHMADLPTQVATLSAIQDVYAGCAAQCSAN